MYAQETEVIEEGAQPIKAATILFIAGTIIFITLIAYVIVRLARSGAAEKKQEGLQDKPVFSEETVNAPEGLFYDRTHTWVFMEKDGNVRVGIDDFLQHITGKVTKLKMKEPGQRLERGEYLATLIQDGKQLTVYSPVTGVVTENNSELAGRTGLINKDPYSGGWLYRVKPDNWMKETRKYFLGDSYNTYLKDEFARLKDFIATRVKKEDFEYSHVILQDGGEVKDNLLEEFEPDLWEEFQLRFINPANK